MKHQNHNGVLENINITESCLVILWRIPKGSLGMNKLQKSMEGFVYSFPCLKSLTGGVHNITLFDSARATRASENDVVTAQNSCWLYLQL